MTTPAASPPSPSSAIAPNATTTSRKFSPAARTWTRICPGPNSGGRLGRDQGQVGQITLAGGGQLPVRGRWRGQGTGSGSAGECGRCRRAGPAGVRPAGRTAAQDGQQVCSVAAVSSVSSTMMRPRVLVLGGVDQRPHRGVRQIRGPVIGTGAHRVAGQDHQRGCRRCRGGPASPAARSGRARVRACTRGSGSASSSAASGSGNTQITSSGHGSQGGQLGVDRAVVQAGRQRDRVASVHTAHSGGRSPARGLVVGQRLARPAPTHCRPAPATAAGRPDAGRATPRRVTVSMLITGAPAGIGGVQP